MGEVPGPFGSPIDKAYFGKMFSPLGQVIFVVVSRRIWVRNYEFLVVGVPDQLVVVECYTTDSPAVGPRATVVSLLCFRYTTVVILVMQIWVGPLEGVEDSL